MHNFKATAEMASGHMTVLGLAELPVISTYSPTNSTLFALIPGWY
jgi:hypothetical protein